MMALVKKSYILRILRWIPLLWQLCLMTSCGNIRDWLAQDRNDSTSAPEVVTGQDIPEDPAYLAGLTNSNNINSMINLRPWLERGFHGTTQTIAILDNGFKGLDASLGRHLPPNLRVSQGPIANSADTLHGTKLAEVIFALTSGSPDWHLRSLHPQIKLYNANGFSNFAAAVDQAIMDKVDIIVYSQVWEFGGNFDGRGFINAVVNRATAAGILWINAAGNYAASAWHGPLLANSDATARLPYEGKFVRLMVSEPETPVKITLSWNDFTDSKDWRTSRDLDLVLLDPNGQQLAAARKIQDGYDHGRNPDYSAHARETIDVTLEPGVYLLRVDIRSRNFDANSRIRLAANGQAISLIDQTADASVMIPADNPSVLTVGASDDPSSSFGRTMGGVIKPEVLAPSILEFESGITFQGSSSAAAVAAAALAIYREACGRFSKDQLVNKIANGQIAQRSIKGYSLRLPLPGNCF